MIPTSSLQDKVELLIIGCGPAASLYAAKASAAGRQVLMLEAGPRRQMSDLISSQIWARRLKWAGSPVTEQGNLNIGHAFNSGWGTGGSGMHHFAVWPRLHHNDFKLHSLHGVGLDWPIDYDDLRPYYDRIQREVGISGDAQEERWRPKGEPYPMPPLPIFAQASVIRRGFEKLGLHTAAMPLAINSRPYRGRPGCLYDGWCDAGCPTGALANPLALYLPQAMQQGCEIRHQAVATRLLYNHHNRRLDGVEYRDIKGQLHIQPAEHVVLAAGSVENSRLMLASANRHAEQGLANRSGCLGRYLMTHPATSIYALFDQPTQPHLGVNGGQLINQDHYDNKAAIAGALGSYQWLIGQSLKPNDLLGIANSRPDITGRALLPFMREATTQMGNMVFVGEDLPRAENRVTLQKQRDRWGVPLALASHHIGEKTEQLCNAATAEGKAIFRAAGARELWTGPRFGMHIMGGTMMGDDPEKSVTNRFGRCHDIDNLHIAGSSLFPSSGAVNPTFTLLALALSGVEQLLYDWH